MVPPVPRLSDTGVAVIVLALASLKITLVLWVPCCLEGEGCAEAPPPGSGSTEMSVLAWFSNDAPKPNNFVKPSWGGVSCTETGRRAGELPALRMCSGRPAW